MGRDKPGTTLGGKVHVDTSRRILGKNEGRARKGRHRGHNRETPEKEETEERPQQQEREIEEVPGLVLDEMPGLQISTSYEYS